MPPPPPPSRRLPSIGLGLAIVSCYGMLALVGLASALGLSLSPDETLWKAAILAGAALTLPALVAGLRRHRGKGPLLLALAATALLGYTLFGDFDRLREAFAFTLLAAAVWMDRRLCAPSQPRGRA